MARDWPETRAVTQTASPPAAPSGTPLHHPGQHSRHPGITRLKKGRVLPGTALPDSGPATQACLAAMRSAWLSALDKADNLRDQLFKTLGKRVVSSLDNADIAALIKLKGTAVVEHFISCAQKDLY